MDEEATDGFEVRRAPNGKFYITRGAAAICTGTDSLLYFDEERDALEFLVELVDIETDLALGRLFQDVRKHATEKSHDLPTYYRSDEIQTSTE
jgi:hypothetical protein